MRKIIILVAGYLCYAIGATAQSGPKAIKQISPQSITEVKALSVGDNVPDILFENVINYKSKKAKLSDFRGKLVILDMWSVWCTSCIAAFPKMEKLQNEFKDKIQILLVNAHDKKYNSEVKIKSLLNNNKRRSGFYPSLPIPIHDSILNSYFPHRSVPHLVWIDGNGKVVAITGSIDVTAENIEAILVGKKINLPTKDDKAFDRSKPMLVDNNGGQSDDIVFRSLFTSYRGGIGFGGGARADENNQVIGYYLLNNSLRQLISSAYSDSMNGFPESRVFLQVEDPDKYKLQFDPNNAYCYDLTIQSINPKDFNLKKYLKKDLEYFFNIRVKKERRKLNCYIIDTTSKIVYSFTKYRNSSIDLNESSINKYFHNYPIAKVINYLGQYFDIPLVDESNMSQQCIDLDFPSNFTFSDSEAILQELKRVGFSIKKASRELDVVVISDK